MFHRLWTRSIFSNNFIFIPFIWFLKTFLVSTYFRLDFFIWMKYLCFKFNSCLYWLSLINRILFFSLFVNKFILLGNIVSKICIFLTIILEINFLVYTIFIFFGNQLSKNWFFFFKFVIVFTVIRIIIISILIGNYRFGICLLSLPICFLLPEDSSSFSREPVQNYYRLIRILGVVLVNKYHLLFGWLTLNLKELPRLSFSRK